MACGVCLDGIDPRESLPQIKWIRDFVTVAACGSMSAAGRELGKSRQAVHHSVSHLEEHLAMKLFERDRYQSQLTDAGRLLLPVMQQCIRLLSATVGR